MTDDTCGHETPNGPCKNPATEGDHCWIKSHGGDVDGHGRDWSITEDDHDDILDAARVGLSQSGCARAAGVDEKCLRRYLDAHPDFRRAFMRARERGERRLAERGLTDPDVDSSMAKFLLSTSFGYVKTEKREVDMDANVDVTTLDADEKAQLNDLLDRDVQE